MRVKMCKNYIPGTYTSLIVKGDAMVEYKINEWSEPPEWLAEEGYGLIVFETLTEALYWEWPETLFDHNVDYLYNSYKTCFFTVDLDGPPMPTPVMIQPESIGNRKWNSSWARWPVGSRFYKRVRILQRIRNSDVREILQQELKDNPDLQHYYNVQNDDYDWEDV